MLKSQKAGNGKGMEMNKKPTNMQSNMDSSSMKGMKMDSSDASMKPE
jgi:hypothetical protein